MVTIQDCAVSTLAGFDASLDMPNVFVFLPAFYRVCLTNYSVASSVLTVRGINTYAR